MPLLLKVLLVLAKSRRGRELLFAASLAGIRIATSPRARAAYATARGTAVDVGRMAVSRADRARPEAERSLAGVARRLRRPGRR